MALVLRGGEFIATEALSANTLADLSDLASRQPLVINGLELRHQDLADLAEEARRTGQPVWPRPLSPTNFISLSWGSSRISNKHHDKRKVRTLETW